jgi:hypothetical protein
MDPRGVGLWDMQELSTMEEAIWAMDHDETGKNGDVSLFVIYSQPVLILTFCMKNVHDIYSLGFVYSYFFINSNIHYYFFF